jgi:serine protease AprX
MSLVLPRLFCRARTVALALLLAVAATLAVPSGEALRGITWTRHPAVDPSLKANSEAPVRAIVQARPGFAPAAAAAVRAVGGTVLTDLPLVEGFVAKVPGTVLDGLAANDAVRAVSADHRVQFDELSYDSTSTASNFPKTSGASTAWAQGRLGTGVGVAVIDTGVSQMADFEGRLVHGPDLSGEGVVVDNYGHGTVMAGIIGGSGADSASNPGGKYAGVAPKSTVIAVKAAGRNGSADVSTMLQAMHWVAAYKDQFNIRVLNLSWGTKSVQDPSLDPLNYAVERLWDLGIVVVTAAGNAGPQSGTVTKPGDDPVVLTVGAYDDKQNLEPADDSLSAWSSRGPTAAGLTKPDILAPGRTLIAPRSYGSSVEVDNPKALVTPSYIKGSGTSQAAAVVSGLAALLIEARPELTPDQVKAILRGTALPISGVTADNQGVGRVQLGAALAAAPPANAAQARPATGLGSIEASRGGMNVMADCGNDGTADVIQGEIDVRCEAWTGSAWTGSAWTGSAWTGSAWTGSAWTGSAWTGSAWTGSAWTGSAWTGGTWTGSAWTGSAWTGSAWTGSAWTGSAWTGSAWTGSAWTGSAWTTAEYADDFYLTAFWGDKPKPGKYVPGEPFTPNPGRRVGNPHQLPEA